MIAKDPDSSLQVFYLQQTLISDVILSVLLP